MQPQRVLVWVQGAGWGVVLVEQGGLWEMQGLGGWGRVSWWVIVTLWGLLVRALGAQLVVLLGLLVVLPQRGQGGLQVVGHHPSGHLALGG